MNLDEYCGLSPDNVHSYAYFMRKYLFDRVNISLSNTNIPDGLAENGELECIRYDKVIQKLGGVDMQLHNDVTVVADTAALSFIKG